MSFRGPLRTVGAEAGKRGPVARMGGQLALLDPGAIGARETRRLNELARREPVKARQDPRQKLGGIGPHVAKLPLRLESSAIAQLLGPNEGDLSAVRGVRTSVPRPRQGLRSGALKRGDVGPARLTVSTPGPGLTPAGRAGPAMGHLNHLSARSSSGRRAPVRPMLLGERRRQRGPELCIRKTGGDTFGNWSNGPPPSVQCERELVGQRSKHPARALTSLVEIMETPRSVEQSKGELVDLWPDRLHEIERQRVTSVGVHVEHAQPRIKPDCQARQASLGLKQGVQIVEDRIRWVRRKARIAGDRRGTGPERSPVARHPLSRLSCGWLSSRHGFSRSRAFGTLPGR
jgi:hypothetical protein